MQIATATSSPANTKHAYTLYLALDQLTPGESRPADVAELLCHQPELEQHLAPALAGFLRCSDASSLALSQRIIMNRASSLCPHHRFAATDFGDSVIPMHPSTAWVATDKDNALAVYQMTEVLAHPRFCAVCGLCSIGIARCPSSLLVMRSYERNKHLRMAMGELRMLEACALHTHQSSFTHILNGKH